MGSWRMRVSGVWPRRAPIEPETKRASRTSQTYDRQSLPQEVFGTVPRPKFTRLSRFVDSVEEADYRDSRRDKFISRLLWFSIVVMFIVCPMLYVNLNGMGYREDVVWWSILSEVVPVLCMIASCMLAQRTPRVSLSVLEWIMTVSFHIAALRLIFLTPSGLTRLLHDPAHEGVDTPVGRLLRALVVIQAAGLFAGFEVDQLIVIALSCTAYLVLSATVLPLSRSILEDSSEFGISMLMLVSTAYAVSHRTKVERGVFHFERAIVARSLEWQAAKAAELEAEQEAAKAKVANDARAKMIRVVMHDLRSPLLAVRSMAESLSTVAKAPWFIDEMAKNLVNSIQSCAALMEGIVSDMLDFERIDSGHMQLVLQPFSLSRFFLDAEHANSALAMRREVRLVTQPLSHELCRARFVGDQQRLLQCLGNGLSNAIKFSNKGQTVALSVELMPRHSSTAVSAPRASGDGPADEALGAEAADSLQEVRIVVKDEGVGIARDEMEVLRKGEVFSQVGKGQLQGNGGTGLGLSIVRSILKLHNDSYLTLESEGHDRGTAFVMHLLLRRAPDAPLSRSASYRSLRMSSEFLESVASHAEGRASGGIAATRSRTLSRNASGKPGGGGGSAPTADGDLLRSTSAGGYSRNSGGEQEDGLSEVCSEVLLNPPLPGDAPGGGAAAHAAWAGGDGAPAAAVSSRDRLVRCLHVEDDMMLQLTISARLFAREGVEYRVASDGQEALDIVNEREACGEPPFNLVLLDNQMPRLDGVECCRRLRQLGFLDQIIIGMTGDPIGSPDRAAFEAAGLNACVDKTMDGLEAVQAQVESLVQAATGP